MIIKDSSSTKTALISTADSTNKKRESMLIQLSLNKRITKNSLIITMNFVVAALRMRTRKMVRKMITQTTMMKIITFLKLRQIRGLEGNTVYLLFSGFRSSPRIKSLR
jgi:heme/copper-type cytochrome/quinol oxidase subunit 1